MSKHDPISVAEPPRLIADIEHLSTLVDSSLPGWSRQALTELDSHGREWVAGQMRSAGLVTHIDGAGNVIGVLRGTSASGACIMTGSHTDTVEGGGRYDGIVGVAAALEVARTIRDAGVKLVHDLVVVNFFSEEPNRFGISCVGSRAMTGFITRADLDRVDATGRSFGAELARSGIDPDQLLSSRIDTSKVRAFVELHIEQGPYLEEHGSEIGVVTSITGIKRFHAAFHGRPDHAGTTPMHRRQDAGCAAAGSVLAIEKIASGNVDGRGTTGLVTFAPEAVNVVTETAELWGEFRSPDLGWLEHASETFADAARDESDRRSVELQLDWLPSERPALMEEKFNDIVSAQADRLGLKQSRLYSGAEHDAAIIAKLIPTAMIFVPSKDGRSHCAEEFTADTDVRAGADVLLNTILTLDRQLDAR